MPKAAKQAPRSPPAKYRIDFLKSHRAYVNAKGDKLPGVTTVLKMLNKPALLHWAWKLGKEGVEMDAVRDQAADIGTIAHALCEAHLRGLDLDTANIAPEMLDRAETSFLKFLSFWDREQLQLVRAEYPMVSERMQVGGTLDILAARAGTPTRLVLVDLKSSKAIYDEMLLQTSAYAAMYEEQEGQHVDEVYIVRIGKEDGDDLEVREVNNRMQRVAAFTALAHARRLLQGTGMRV